MKYQYSQLTSKMKASKIRELMKYASMPGVISFGGGMPDPENFPFTDIKEIIGLWDKNKSIQAMQYGTTTGYMPLVDSVFQRMTGLKKMKSDNQQIVITTGGQQGIFLLSRIFLDKDDVVLLEEPSFIGAVASFLSCEAKLEGVTLEDDGVCLEELEEKLLRLRSEGKTVKFFYTIPNFQNPKGSTMSQEKRQKLYDLSIKHNLVIIEDDPYGDLYYEGNEGDYLSIKSIGNEAPIIYVGSFSKVLCPGFRLGWIYADNEIIDKASLAKQSIDACSSSFGQVIAADYLNLDKIDLYLSKMREIYRKKRDCMLEAIDKHFPQEIMVTRPKGGFFIYCKLPKGISGSALFMETIKEKVAFVTGEPFHTDPILGDGYMRISFSNSSYEQIELGISVIGKAVKKSMNLLK